MADEGAVASAASAVAPSPEPVLPPSAPPTVAAEPVPDEPVPLPVVAEAPPLPAAVVSPEKEEEQQQQQQHQQLPPVAAPNTPAPQEPQEPEPEEMAVPTCLAEVPTIKLDQWKAINLDGEENVLGLQVFCWAPATLPGTLRRPRQLPMSRDRSALERNALAQRWRLL